MAALTLLRKEGTILYNIQTGISPERRIHNESFAVFPCSAPRPRTSHYWRSPFRWVRHLSRTPDTGTGDRFQRGPRFFCWLFSACHYLFYSGREMQKMEKNHVSRMETEGQSEFYRRDDRHLNGMFSVSWRGPFEGFSAGRKVEAPEPASFSPSEMRWRGPFEGLR